MKFQTQLTAKDIFKFSMMYTYSGASGIFSIVMIIVGFYVHSGNRSGPGLDLHCNRSPDSSASCSDQSAYFIPES